MGHAVFQLQDQRLVLQRSAKESAKVDKRWITRTGLVVEGLVGQPYIQLDIRTPFNETVGTSQVDAGLSESLGPRQGKFRRGGWHIQFVEDTNLGSNHRIFIDLEDSATKTEAIADRDACLTLEIAMEALGELVMAEKGETNFQLLYGGSHFCMSLLFVNGSPFHVLRLDEAVGSKAALRLRQHREFALAQGKSGGAGLKTYLAVRDPLAQCEDIQTLGPQDVTLGLPNNNDQDFSLLLHLGLAQAARQSDLMAHNRVSARNRSRNSIIRSRALFLSVMGITTLACLAIAGILAVLIQQNQRQLQHLLTAAAAYQGQVADIRELRHEKTTREAELQSLKPVWHRAVDWATLFSELSQALPNDAGMDGLSVVRKPDGHLELTFRAWVKDWDKVQSIQRSLSATSFFSSVSLSEQRKDLTSGVVVFHVTGHLVRD